MPEIRSVLAECPKTARFGGSLVAPRQRSAFFRSEEPTMTLEFVELENGQVIANPKKRKSLKRLRGEGRGRFYSFRLRDVVRLKTRQARKGGQS